jgi:hypothetical protein
MFVCGGSYALGAGVGGPRPTDRCYRAEGIIDIFCYVVSEISESYRNLYGVYGVF